MKKAAIAALAVGAATGVGAYKFFEWVFNALVGRDFEVPSGLASFITESEKKKSKEKRISADMKWLLDYGFETHSIVNENGHRLQGYLMRPAKESNVYVFCAHGYRSDGKNEWCHYAKYYVETLGFNMFFVDHQAAGESEGRYIGFSSYESRDSMKWLEYMLENFGRDIEIILHGISMGSTTVILMTGNEKLPENVKFTVADCGFTSAMDEFMYKLESLHIPKYPVLPIIKAFQKKRVGYDFHKDTNALGAIDKAKIPMFFIHGSKDKFVPTFMAHQFYDACKSAYKDILIVEGADHARSYCLDKAEYERRINNLIERFISA